MIQTVGAVEGKDSQQQDAVVSSHSSGEKKTYSGLLSARSKGQTTNRKA